METFTLYITYLENAPTLTKEQCQFLAGAKEVHYFDILSLLARIHKDANYVQCFLELDKFIDSLNSYTHNVTIPGTYWVHSYTEIPIIYKEYVKYLITSKYPSSIEEI